MQKKLGLIIFINIKILILIVESNQYEKSIIKNHQTNITLLLLSPVVELPMGKPAPSPLDTQFQKEFICPIERT
jgi:hypothetical protein